jgi:hypothetical protein
MGIGEYRTVDLPYRRWSGMINRCYDTRYVERNGSSYFNECSVHEDWHNYQNFAKWFFSYENMPENFKYEHRLDKDLRVKDNRVYSADTCCLIPNKLNTVLAYNKSRDGLPAGVTRTSKRNSIYRVRCSDVNGNTKDLGRFRDVDVAFAAYSEFKKTTINLLADKYLKEKMITQLTYQAVLDYTL